MVTFTPSLVSGPNREGGRSRAQGRDLAAAKRRTLKQAAPDRAGQCLPLDAPLRIEWQEVGGPVVQPPARSGYGMEVIRGLLPYELDGKVDLAFASTGVRCFIDIPVSQLANGWHATTAS